MIRSLAIPILLLVAACRPDGGVSLIGSGSAVNPDFHSGGQPSTGKVSEEEPLQEVGDAVASFPAPAPAPAEDSIVVEKTRPLSLRVSMVGEFKIDDAQVNVFSTPMAYYDGAIYLVNVEPGGAGKDGLVTVVRKGVPRTGGGWQWESHVIEPDTIRDPYHTQASIGIDRHGYIHVAYNMHNMPWQYSVSIRPGDISEFQFRGDRISQDDRDAVRANKTPFPSLGSAAIPGNQITYPAFFNDRNGELYVTYRFATRPRLGFADRGFAGGVAKYDVGAKTWRALGGAVTITSDEAVLPDGDENATVRVFAYTDKWSVYLMWLSFDEKNNMHVSWLWREGGAGDRASHPSYAFSSDGGATFRNGRGELYNLPVPVKDADVFAGDSKSEFEHRSMIAVDEEGLPYIYVGDLIKGRMLIHKTPVGGWSVPESLPNGASAVFIDQDGRFWAVANGPTFFVREGAEAAWQRVFAGVGSFGHFRVLTIPGERKFFLFSANLDAGRARIEQITY